MFKTKHIVYLSLSFLIVYFVFTALRIYQFSFSYSERKSDVAIVLGAGTNDDKLSPIFKERINHSIYLYKNERVGWILFTGGQGENQEYADSEIARQYALKMGVPSEAIIIEELSKFTIENLKEAQKLMVDRGLKTALLVSDPLHMKRSIDLAHHLHLECEPSPTKTTMYRSISTKGKSLLYETTFYALGEILGKN